MVDVVCLEDTPHFRGDALKWDLSLGTSRGLTSGNVQRTKTRIEKKKQKTQAYVFVNLDFLISG